MINDRLSILLVDDDPLVLRALSRALRGHRLHMASDVQTAAEIMQRTPVDLVVTDYAMPGSDGIALLELARRVYPRVGRALMSGAPPSSLPLLQRTGIVEMFVAKPFDRTITQELCRFGAQHAGAYAEDRHQAPSDVAPSGALN